MLRNPGPESDPGSYCEFWIRSGIDLELDSGRSNLVIDLKLANKKHVDSKHLFFTFSRGHLKRAPSIIPAISYLNVPEVVSSRRLSLLTVLSCHGAEGAAYIMCTDLHTAFFGLLYWKTPSTSQQ